jgi:hypothetical protein
VIRTIGGRRITIAEIRECERVRDLVDQHHPQRVKPRKPRVPRTEIVICVSCRKAYPLHSHDPATCARTRGHDGDWIYRQEHALVSLCASGCGAIVSSPGAVCIGCIGGHA